MKKYTLLLILSLFLGLTSCKKDDDHKDPIDQLPPATQTGAGTFAALVDGKPFIANNPWFNCFYQFVDGEYYFGIQGIDDKFKYSSNPWSIGIGTYKKTIANGEILYLLEAIDGNAWGGGLLFTDKRL